jgi:hypothetical protein
LISPAQPIGGVDQNGEVDVAIRSKARAENAAIEEDGPEGQGGGPGENLPEGSREILDSVRHVNEGLLLA